MPKRQVLSLLIAFVVAFIAAALGMRWNLLETRHGLPMGTVVMLLAACLSAVVARGIRNTPVFPTIVVVGLAPPAGVSVIALLAIAVDPSSNNLWPIGAFAVGVFGLLASAAGTIMGSLILMVRVRWAKR